MTSNAIEGQGVLLLTLEWSMLNFLTWLGSQLMLEKGIAMKVLLKRKDHECFLASPGAWTKDITEAQRFKSFLEVLDYRREHGLEGVEAYFHFDDPKYNFVLNIG